MAGYITLAEAKAWLGIDLLDITKDTLIDGLIDTVKEAINAWTESDFSGPKVVTNELHDGRRQDVIVPKGYPLISVEQIVLGVNGAGAGGSVLESLGYNYDDVEIRLRYLNMPQQRSYMRVDYTWGYATVPMRVKTASKIAVEGYYRMRARQSVGITSKAKEGESISYKGSWDAEAGLPKEAVSLLADFRRLEWPDGPGGEMSIRNR